MGGVFGKMGSIVVWQKNKNKKILIIVINLYPKKS